ncbi:MAG: type secretion outer membrane protein TolC [Phenylobacterium sp.]|jgi:outer membrane protein|nr:type secretion outer membrane protein TolC [Phenylobacterium sp.]
MSKSFRGRLLAAIFSAGVAVVVAAPAGAETLADAIALAYDSNPTLQAQRATQRALDENYVQARSGWRPTLTFQAQAAYDQIHTPRAGLTQFGQLTRYEANTGVAVLSFSQPIWTGGRVAAAVSAATGDILQGRENLRRVEAQVLGSVIQAYMDVRRDQQALDIHQQDLQVLQKQLEESQARFDVGEITRTDVALSQARLAASQAQFQSAQAQLAVSRATYAALVGHNPGDLAPEPSLAYLMPGNVDDAFTIAEQNNPTLRAQQYGEAASRARVAAARAERMPSLSGSSSLRFGGAPVEPFNQGLYNREVQAAVTLTVPLFNGGLTTSRIRQAIERNNADRITIETQRRSVLQTITQSWNQLIADRANIASTAEQVRAALIAAEGTRQELQVGLRTTIDVLNAESELRAAQLSQVSAGHDEYVAAATVLLTMGRLEARDLIPTQPQYDAKANFRRLRLTWGWVPWEEPISIVDRVVTIAPAPVPKDRPVEAPIPPGLQPPPTPPAATPRP